MKKVLILGQFFLIIFIYHILKDLKDTLVITASDAGAEVIPYIKIWVILPFAVLASYLFGKVYQKYGREKTLYIFVTVLLSAYAFFAFFLFPLKDELYLNHLAELLNSNLPIGFKGLISMVSYWIYTFFYLAAELWAMIVLSVLFWGYLNETFSVEQAKTFYPMCSFVGNCAGIIAGQSSRYLCHTLTENLSWQEMTQLMILFVIVCGIVIMCINRFLSLFDVPSTKIKKESQKVSFKESLSLIFQSGPLLCIAALVIGFGLTSNLIEVVWKDSVKSVYPRPQDYNAYINQLTSLIGILAVLVALSARWIFRILSWVQVALITPVILLATSCLFFFSLNLPEGYLITLASYLSLNPLYLVMALGSLYFVLSYTAKYTIFDMSKEMAFLTIKADDRLRAKSVIDTVGSRLGKSGSSCLYQGILITFGSTAGQIPIIGVTTICVIGISIIATKKLGHYLGKQENFQLSEAST